MVHYRLHQMLGVVSENLVTETRFFEDILNSVSS
jgi:hypothetical protein